MSDDATVVWIATEDGRSPREDSVRALAGWARARGVTLAPPDPGAARIKVDFVFGERVERELEKAREAIAALDADAAERALSRGEAMLREHPELPQAAWLRAEISRGWASRWARVAPKDDARAQAAAQDADALDEGRALGIGETKAPKRPDVPLSIVVGGVAARDVVVRLDGRVLPGRASGTDMTFGASVADAEHQLVVYLEGEPAFASWVTTSTATTEVKLDLGDIGVCSVGAFHTVKRDGNAVRANGVGCPRWIAVVEGAAGSVSVARCEGASCGPLVEWRTGGVSSSNAAPRDPSTEKRGCSVTSRASCARGTSWWFRRGAGTASWGAPKASPVCRSSSGLASTRSPRRRG